MKSELDKILDSLPRSNGVSQMISRGQEALVSIDQTGALCIMIEDIGLLRLTEKRLSGLKADIDYLLRP